MPYDSSTTRTLETFYPSQLTQGLIPPKPYYPRTRLFSATKSELKAEQGWKVIDLTPNKRVHLSEVLEKIPDKTYSSINEVVKELRRVL